MLSQIKVMTIYRATHPLKFSGADVASQFSSFEFRPRNPSAPSSYGWAPLFARLNDDWFHDRASSKQRLDSEDSLLPAITHEISSDGTPVLKITDKSQRNDSLQSDMIYECNGHILLRLVSDKAEIKSALVEQKLASRVSELEREQGRQLKKKETDSIKEGIIASLLPQAYTKRTSTYLWYDKDSGYLVVFAKGKAAEDATAFLRKTLGSLPIVPVCVKTPAELTMTSWLKNKKGPDKFSIGDYVELTGVLEGSGVAKIKGQDLMGEEVQSHIENKKIATILAMEWSEQISFVLSDFLVISKIKWSDEFLDSSWIGSDDPLAQDDANAVLLTGTLRKFIAELVTALGGENREPL